MQHLNKLLLVCTAMLSLSACNSSDQAAEQTSAKTVDHPPMDWIIGSWVGGVNAEGVASSEVWKKVSEGRYAGDGESRKDGQLISSEHMEISLEDGHHCLIVEHSESDSPVVFNFTYEYELSFICRNEENDFPKQIKYERKGNELIAHISEGGPSMEFRFQKE